MFAIHFIFVNIKYEQHGLAQVLTVLFLYILNYNV